MSTSVILNGTTYFVPAFGDTGYAQGPGNLSSYLIAISNSVLQLSGGSFPLTADANFGTSFGLIAKYFSSVTANAATAGSLRLANTDVIDWRNFANSGNLPLGVNTSDQLTYNGAVISTTTTNGIVNSGTASQVAYYATTGNIVSSTTALTVGSNGPNAVLVGTNTNDSASAGQVGEYIESIVTSVVSSGTGVYDDVTTISLSAGDWEMTLQALGSVPSSNAGVWEIGISTTPGNTFPDRVVGSNMGNVNTVAVNTETMNIAGLRVSLSGTTTMYAKSLWTFGAGTPPNFSGRLSARRVR